MKYGVYLSISVINILLVALLLWMVLIDGVTNDTGWQITSWGLVWMPFAMIGLITGLKGFAAAKKGVIVGRLRTAILVIGVLSILLNVFIILWGRWFF